MKRSLAAMLLLLPTAACASGPPKIVPLGVPVADTPNVPLEVVTRSTAIRDPLPVNNSNVVYGDIEAAMGHAVSSATVQWAAEHQKQRPTGWQLTVELTDATAEEQDGGRLIVSLNARATLRTREGNTYLAQTQAGCNTTGIVTPENGSTVLYNCMTRIGRDLAYWLAGVNP